MEAITIVSAGALLKKITDVLKLIRAGQIGSALTQLLVWVLGIGLFALMCNADLTAGIGIGSLTLGALDGASIVLGGLMFASGASVLLNDVPKQLDNKDTGFVPALLSSLNKGGSAGQPQT